MFIDVNLMDEIKLHQPKMVSGLYELRNLYPFRCQHLNERGFVSLKLDLLGMNKILKYSLFLFAFGCSSEDEPTEAYLDEVISGGGRVLAFYNAENNIITTGNNPPEIYTPAGDFISSLSAEYFVTKIAEGTNGFYTTGFLTGNDSPRVYVEFYNNEGQSLWLHETSGDSITTESPTISFIDDQVIALYFSREDEAETFETTVHWDILNSQGQLVEQKSVKLAFDNITFPPILFPVKALIKNQSEVYVVFNVTVSDGNDTGGKIVYKLTDAGIEWQKEIGVAGFEEVTNLALSPEGNLLVVGSKQGQAWLVLLNDLGNVLWDRDYGIEPGKNWFYDAIFVNNEIKVAGYSNANNEERIGDGWVLSLNSQGEVLHENFYGDENDDRFYVIHQGSDQRLWLGGWRIIENNGPRFDAWVLTTDLNGNR